MNKALIVFSGNYELEQDLPTDVVSFDYLGLGSYCRNCTVNRFAAQGYLEAKNKTNAWADILGQYYNTGLVVRGLSAISDVVFAKTCYSFQLLATGSVECIPRSQVWT